MPHTPGSPVTQMLAHVQRAVCTRVSICNGMAYPLPCLTSRKRGGGAETSQVRQFTSGKPQALAWRPLSAKDDIPDPNSSMWVSARPTICPTRPASLASASATSITSAQSRNKAYMEALFARHDISRIEQFDVG